MAAKPIATLPNTCSPRLELLRVAELGEPCGVGVDAGQRVLAAALAPVALDGARHLDARGRAELHEDVPQVRLHRLVAEEQLGGDLAVGLAVGHQAGDLELALGQRRHAGVPRRGRAALLRARAELAQLAPRGVALAHRAARVQLRLGLAQRRDRPPCARPRPPAPGPGGCARRPPGGGRRSAGRAVRGLRRLAAAPAKSPEASRNAARARAATASGSLSPRLAACSSARAT